MFPYRPVLYHLRAFFRLRIYGFDHFRQSFYPFSIAVRANSSVPLHTDNQRAFLPESC